jgi:hypothetical protein
MEFSGIMLQIVMGVVKIGEVWVMRVLVRHHMRGFLTMILEVGCVLVHIVVAVIDERVGLLEVIGRFLAHTVCVMRECTDATILDMALALKDEFHDVSVLHTDLIIKLMINSHQTFHKIKKTYKVNGYLNSALTL